MKKSCSARFLTAAVLTAVCLIFQGCTKGTPPLLYQEKVASATLSDGERSFRLSPIPGGFSLEITAPSHAAGITYRITDTASAVSVGGVEIPAGENVTAAAKQVIALFTLAEENRTGTDRRPGGMTVRYKTKAGEIAVHLDTDGTPTAFDTPSGTWTVSDFQKKPEG